MLMTSQLKVGTAFMYGDNPLIVQRMLGQRSGRAGMVTNLRVQNLITKSTMDLGLDAGEKFDDVDLDFHTTKLSYIDGDTFVFIDNDTFEQFEMPRESLGDYPSYITPEDDLDIKLTFFNNRPVGMEVPTQVRRRVTYCEPGIKGDTSGKSLKPATLDTGFVAKVPLFITSGEDIIIDTRDGSFIERAK